MVGVNRDPRYLRPGSVELAPNEILVTPRFADVDMMRVLHHSRYWTWLEDARFHFLRTVLDVTPGEIEALDIYTPLVSSSASYRRAVRWGDTVIVAVRMELFEGAKFSFHHTVVDAVDRRTRIASATTMHVFTGLDLRLKPSVPPFYRDKLERALERLGPDTDLITLPQPRAGAGAAR
ncbi:MAG TPA: thioesterase family protein [Longimicrobiaceae bacterium]|nr:thioesterase family protein [Longimicrobiaceae bacterium]